MKWYQSLPALFAVSIAASCSNGMEEGSSSSSTPATTPATVTVPPVQQPQQTAASGTVALNPPHGQPGHRCDIKVGEPLTGTAPATNTQPQMIQQPPAATVVTPPATGTTAAGKNPPHGQPGHRCDIAVGAPLNSKPAQ
jgi:hypothetical protein